jgi:hypothetical protein
MHIYLDFPAAHKSFAHDERVFCSDVQDLFSVVCTSIGLLTKAVLLNFSNGYDLFSCLKKPLASRVCPSRSNQYGYCSIVLFILGLVTYGTGTHFLLSFVANGVVERAIRDLFLYSNAWGTRIYDSYVLS